MKNIIRISERLFLQSSVLASNRLFITVHIQSAAKNLPLDWKYSSCNSDHVHCRNSLHVTFPTIICLYVQWTVSIFVYLELYNNASPLK